MNSSGWRHFLPDGRTRLLGIVGQPLDHSLSPRLQSAVLRLLDRNLIYLPFPVSEERLPAWLETGAALGLVGLNVTTPYKEAVARLVPAADEETRQTGMVNTICFGESGPVGCGTDGAGVLEFVDECGLGKRPLGVLGFGPTARSVIYHAASLGRPARWLITRRPDEVRATLARWGHEQTEVLDWNDLPEGPLGRRTLWISTLPATAAPMPDRFWAWIGPRASLVDMNYGEGRARVQMQARGHAISAADGVGPLCHQAARSLSLWLDAPVEVSLFYRALGRSARSLRPVIGERKMSPALHSAPQ